MKKLISLICLLAIGKNFASFDIQKNIQKLDWNGIEVIYLEDNRFPTFDMEFYFADGAISDLGGKFGETESAFELVSLGTKKYSRDELSEKFEFYGASSDFNITHEYVTYSLSGLTKDLKALTELSCEVLKEATFPEKEIKKINNIKKAAAKTLETNHQALASKVFREYSLKNTPFSYPTSGKIKDLDLLTSENLRKKLDYFLSNVKKRVYLTGPKSVLEIKDVINKKCGFTAETSKFVRTPTYEKKIQNQKKIVFVPVEKANQVQVILGSFLNKDELKDEELAMLASEYLGGGFTSVLTQEIRVKRGLSYGVGAVIGAQKTYGRALISTFTKNETILELIKVLESAIERNSGKNHKINPKQFDLVKQGMIGSYPFKFERTSSFLNELLMMDHTEQNYDEIFKFQDKVKSYTASDVAKTIENVFGKNKRTIFILGDKSLLEKVKKLGKVEVLNYQDYI